MSPTMEVRRPSESHLATSDACKPLTPCPAPPVPSGVGAVVPPNGTDAAGSAGVARDRVTRDPDPGRLDPVSEMLEPFEPGLPRAATGGGAVMDPGLADTLDLPPGAPIGPGPAPDLI